ncbi:MAG: hypothetical protein GX097_01345 [Methanomicrobiales archaeon]|nr:hypothetical protein [Methanomicrobiales archaeon]
MGPVSAKTDSVDLVETSSVYPMGDTITFQGETNLAPGTILLITVEEAAFLPSEKGDEKIFSGTSGTVVVQAGSPPFWSFSFNTLGWSAGKYQFIVEVPKTGVTQSGTFSLVAVEKLPDAPDLTPPAPTFTDTSLPPHSSATVPSPATVPLSPAVCMAGFACMYLFRAKPS